MTHNNVIQSVSSWFKNKNEVKVVSKFSYDFPAPDIQIELNDGKTIQIECKPSGAIKREYLTGFGQAIAYCTQADYSYLAIPSYELNDVKSFFWVDTIGLLSVDYNSVTELREPKITSEKIRIEKKEIKRGYAYYRDLHSKEIYYLIKAIETAKISKLNEINYHNILWDEIKKHRQWSSAKSSNIANMKILLRDLKLINSSDFSLLPNAEELIKLGDQNNWIQYNNTLSRIILLDGNYIDIVALIQELNDKYYNFSNISYFKEKLKEKILAEKLAKDSTNIMRDLQDIPRILIELDILVPWNKIDMLGGRFSINWKKILPFIKNR